jgi:biopolymer transport protein TolQ
MTTHLSFWTLVVEASWIVQLVLLLLLAASVTSWSIMFQKRALFRKFKAAARTFDLRYDAAGADLGKFYRQISEQEVDPGIFEQIFQAGYREYARLLRLGNSGLALEGARRSMLATERRAVDSLEEQLPFLATVGSVSPYVGLFGTVWGIMTAFHALGNVQQATLSMVAPGISQALIATAMGLFAAIPAVIAYNRFQTELSRMENRMEGFIDEFSAVLQRYQPVAAGGESR